MDLDEIKLGHVYTDIGFIFHRFLIASIEQAELSERGLSISMSNFFEAYKKGNPSLDFNMEKLIIAVCNRALLNILVPLNNKYGLVVDNTWWHDIPANIKRLHKIKYFISLILSNPNFAPSFAKERILPHPLSNTNEVEWY